MAEAETAFAPLLAGLPRGEEGVRVREAGGLGLATVMAMAGQADAAAGRLNDAFGLPARDAPVRAVAGGTWAAGIGPGAWLVGRQDAGPDWADTVEAALGDAAAVFDQGSGYAVLELAGPGAARLLQKGADIDLHPDAFPPGTVAVTVIAHLGVILWRAEDELFGAAVFRSLAGSFWHWLAGAAAMAGTPLHLPD